MSPRFMKREASMRAILLLLMASVLASSCNFNSKSPEKLSLENDFAFIKINDEYGVHIPTYMKKSDALNDEASLQFANIFKETYVIVIDEPKEEFISVFTDLNEYIDTVSTVKNYRTIQLQLLSENINIIKQSLPKPAKIHKLNAELIQFDGRVEGVDYDIAYTVGFIEGNENLYMIMTWTLAENKEKYKETFDKIIRSFRLLN